MDETTVTLPRYLKPAQAADYLQIAESTLADWRHRRVGPPFVKAGGVRYDATELHRWLQSRIQQTKTGGEDRS